MRPHGRDVSHVSDAGKSRSYAFCMGPVTTTYRGAVATYAAIKSKMNREADIRRARARERERENDELFSRNLLDRPKDRRNTLDPILPELAA